MNSKRKKGTGVTEDKAKKILEKYAVFAKQFLQHLHEP